MGDRPNFATRGGHFAAAEVARGETVCRQIHRRAGSGVSGLLHDLLVVCSDARAPALAYMPITECSLEYGS